MTFAIKNFGCKVNHYELQAMQELLKGQQHRLVSAVSQADIVLVNTCTVTEVSATKSRKFIESVLRKYPHMLLVVTGCFIEEHFAEYASRERIIPVRNYLKDQILSVIEAYQSHSEVAQPERPIKESKYVPLKVSEFTGRTRGFIKIQDGCNQFCSYCKIPFVRGISRSRPFREIVPEAERLVECGIKEIVVTGICVGLYGKDLAEDLTLADVVAALARVHGLERIRLSSVEPEQVTDDLIAVIKTKLYKS